MSHFIVSRRGILPWIVCAGLSSTRRVLAASPDAAMEAFRDEVLAVGNRNFPDMHLKAGPGSDAVISLDHNLRLENLFAQVRDVAPSVREPVIINWLSKFTPAADVKADAIKDATDTWENAEPLLRPKLIGRISPEMKDRLIYRPYVADLFITYAIDLGDKDLYVSRDKAARWCRTQDAVHARAVDNLERMSRNIGRSFDSNGAILDISMSDGYDAARLILPGLRARLLKGLGSPFYAGVPARDLFIVWSKGDDKFQGEMAAAVRDAAASMGHPVSDRVYVVDEQGVRPA